MSKKKLAGIIAASKNNEGIAVESSIAASKSSFEETSYEIYIGKIVLSAYLPLACNLSTKFVESFH
jgi:hypothetical protein